jgi:hypothetical protein
VKGITVNQNQVLSNARMSADQTAGKTNTRLTCRSDAVVTVPEKESHEKKDHSSLFSTCQTGSHISAIQDRPLSFTRLR